MSLFGKSADFWGGLVQVSFSPLLPARGRINLGMCGGKLSVGLFSVFLGDKTKHDEPVLSREQGCGGHRQGREPGGTQAHGVLPALLPSVWGFAEMLLVPEIREKSL